MNSPKPIPPATATTQRQRRGTSASAMISAAANSRPPHSAWAIWIPLRALPTCGKPVASR